MHHYYVCIPSRMKTIDEACFLSLILTSCSWRTVNLSHDYKGGKFARSLFGIRVSWRDVFQPLKNSKSYFFCSRHQHHLSRAATRNQPSFNNKRMDSVQPIKSQQGSASLKSFFQQLARDHCVKGFTLVTDNALLSPCDHVKRDSAPLFINGATHQPLSYDETPSCPIRRNSSRDLCSEYSSPSTFLENIFDEVLDTVLDDMASILSEVDERDEEYEDDSIVSEDCEAFAQEQIVAASSQELHPDFDASFQRFDETPECSTRSCSFREQMIAPQLPVRRDSFEVLSSSETSAFLRASSISSVVASAAKDDSHKSSSKTPPSARPLHESPATYVCQGQDKLVSCHCATSTEPTARYILDMKEMNDIFTPDSSSKYHGRRRQRGTSRRSSLDTGATFRSSFTSQSRN